MSATNPESGTISYSYDPNGNLTSKTDARSITTSYTYDALNRVTQRSYSGETGYTTPAVSYFYDNLPNAKGKLTKVSSSVSTTEYISFDILGRVTGHKQTTDGQSYSTGYAYNLSGALVEQTYPSGRVVKNVIDNNGDLSMVQSSKCLDGTLLTNGVCTNRSGLWSYARNFTYNAAGAVTSMQLGNGRWESTQFNSRLQPTLIALGATNGATDLLKLDYSYGTTNNNGNVLSQTITVPTVGSNAGFVATQNYIYDSLNRLTQATETISGNQSWKQTFGYDRFGNRTALQEFEGNTLVNDQTPQIDATNNRFTTASGFTYDLSGNVITDNLGRTFNYDSENKQRLVKDANGQTIGEYFFDGDGKRIKKVSNTETVIFVYDAPGKTIAEYANEVAPPQDAKITYLTADHLGSPRIKTDETGQVISRDDLKPFGEEIYTGSGGRTTAQGYGDSDNVRQKFTGYERDNENDLDFAQTRYFNSGFGRFSSPDPFGGSGFVTVPQSWNRYIYCLNRPTVFIDPSGMIWLTMDDQNFIWIDDKEYEKNGEKYKDYRSANGTVILLESISRKKYKNLVGSHVSLNSNGTVSAAAEPASVEVRAEYDDNEISNPWGGLGSLRTPTKGKPNGYDKFRGNGPGKYTLRFYNGKGSAKVDIDFGHNHGAGDPHAHWWDWNDEAYGPRQPGSEIPVGSEESVDEDGDRIIKPPAELIDSFVVLPVPGRVPVPVRPTVPIRIPIRIPVLVPVIP